MSKIRAFVAAALITIPALTLDAAQVPMSQSPAPVISDAKPTTAELGCCFWICIYGVWICFSC
ncbi:MAG TPA: hypothetical protein VE907_01445 [Gammaproteobacteria bacterium]|nr:hypothetical protein [Gammaproteobacteria bacterium]